MASSSVVAMRMTSSSIVATCMASYSVIAACMTSSSVVVMCMTSLRRQCRLVLLICAFHHLVLFLRV